MKIGLLVAALVFGARGAAQLLDGLNAWVELGIKFAGLAAAIGAGWRWLVGPCWRRARGVVKWTGAQLELIGELRERLGAIEARLDQGHAHFERLDTAIESLASEEARAVRRSMRTGKPVVVSPSGRVDRRESS
jgi:hypothetical protein